MDSSARARWPTGFPDPVLLSIPADGIIPATGSPPELHLRRASHPTSARARCIPGTSRSSAQLPYRFTADVAYVGNRGVNLVMDVDTNASMVYGSGNAGRPQFAPFNRTGTSRTRTNDNKSQYNALQMKMDRRFQQRVPRHQLVHVQQVRWTYANENTGISTPIDFNTELGAIELRPDAQLRAPARSTNCRGARARSG